MGTEGTGRPPTEEGLRGLTRARLGELTRTAGRGESAAALAAPRSRQNPSCTTLPRRPSSPSALSHSPALTPPQRAAVIYPGPHRPACLSS